MSGIKPINTLSYDFDFLRIPLKEAANVTLTLPKATGVGTGWADGDTVNASTSAGILTVTGAAGTAVGTAIGVATDDDATGTVYLNGNDLITTYEYQIGGVNTKGALHIGGVAGTIWSANAGYCTPVDNEIIVADQSFDALFDMSDMTSLAIMHRVKQGATQNANARLFQYGAKGKSTPGGVVIEYRSGGTIDFECWPNNVAGTGNVSNKAWGTTGAENWIACLLDFNTGVQGIAKDGDYTNATNGGGDPAAILETQSKYPWLGTAGNYAFSLLCGHDTADAADVWINNTSGSLHVSDFIIMKNAVNTSSFVNVFAAYADGESNEMRQSLLAT